METPYPPTNRYGLVNHLYGPLRRPLTLLRTTTDLLRPYTDTLTLLQTVTDPLTSFTDPYKTSFPYYILHYIVWQILVSKLIKAKKSRGRELTLRP